MKGCSRWISGLAPSLRDGNMRPHPCSGWSPSLLLGRNPAIFWRWSQRENWLREESFKQYKFMVWDSHSWKDLKRLASVVRSDEDRPCSHAAWEDVFRRAPSLLTPLSPSLSLLQFADGLRKMSIGSFLKVVIGQCKGEKKKNKSRKKYYFITTKWKETIASVDRVWRNLSKPHLDCWWGNKVVWLLAYSPDIPLLG